MKPSLPGFFLHAPPHLWILFLVLYLRNTNLSLYQDNNCLLFPRRIMVFGFTCMSIIHFRLIFTYDTKYMSKFFFFCTQLLNCSSIYYEKNDLFSTKLPLNLLKLNWLLMCGSIFGNSFLFHKSVDLSLCQYHTDMIALAL